MLYKIRAIIIVFIACSLFRYPYYSAGNILQLVLATWESELHELDNKLQGLSTAIFIYIYLNVDKSQ